MINYKLQIPDHIGEWQCMMQMTDNTLCSLMQVTIIGRDPRNRPNLSHVLTRAKDKTILCLSEPVISLYQ